MNGDVIVKFSEGQKLTYEEERQFHSTLNDIAKLVLIRYYRFLCGFHQEEAVSRAICKAIESLRADYADCRQFNPVNFVFTSMRNAISNYVRGDYAKEMRYREWEVGHEFFYSTAAIQTARPAQEDIRDVMLQEELKHSYHAVQRAYQRIGITNLPPKVDGLLENAGNGDDPEGIILLFLLGKVRYKAVCEDI